MGFGVAGAVALSALVIAANAGRVVRRSPLLPVSVGSGRVARREQSEGRAADDPAGPPGPPPPTDEDALLDAFLTASPARSA